MSNINEMLTSLRFFAKRHPQPYTEMIEAIEAMMLDKDSEIKQWDTVSHNFMEQTVEQIKRGNRLTESLELILSAEDRGFGMDYVKGCARATLNKEKKK